MAGYLLRYFSYLFRCANQHSTLQAAAMEPVGFPPANYIIPDVDSTIRDVRLLSRIADGKQRRAKAFKIPG